MRYTTQSIDRVREADIYTTIKNFIDLKKAGSNYKAKSPFTEEKTPSFVVSPAKQIFKCYSTHLGGDGIKFVQLYEKCEFIEAVEKIAQIHNIFLEKEIVTPEVQRKIDQKAEMYKLLDSVSRSYVNAYGELPEEHWVKKMIQEREFSKDSILNFQLGFSPEGNKLTKWSIEQGLLQVAKELGLSKTKDAHSYDFFKNRIMFPIHNEKGTVVGFGGRQNNSENFGKNNKYINSPSSLIYDKSAILYGLFQAKHDVLKKGTAILTEGYTDVISMHQHGCENTLASSGTALSERHAKLLKKYAQEVVLLRDGDSAGLKATIRDIDVCLSEGLSVSLCMLPDNEDPDSFARKTSDMQSWINENKQDALLWKTQRYDLKRSGYDDDVNDIRETSKFQIKALQDAFQDLEKLEGEKLVKAKKENKEISDEISAIKKQSEKEIRDLPVIDPNKKATAVTEIAKTLFLIKNEVKRNEYSKQISKILKVTIGSLKSEIGALEIQELEKKSKDTGKISLKGIKLPEGAKQEEYMEGHGFVTVNNSYYFQMSNNEFIQGTTFKMQPLFHIQGDNENKRLCEITNLRGKKKLIDFDSDMLANFNDFRRFLFRIGGFMFLTHHGIRTEHFDKFVYRYEEQFEPALELITMGWNKKGFFAFANGVFWEGEFRNANKYGIIHLEGIDTKESVYNEKIDYYYSPAFSVMYQGNQEGDDDYENDRYFVYNESSISLNDWQLQMKLVFQEKGTIGILFVFGAIFRDLFLSHYDFFPLLAGFGEKDSGKSAFGKVIQNFFYYRLPPLDLTQATHVGFSRRLSRNTNTVQFCDEYQDKNVKEDVFNGLMGAWNGIGREKGKGVGTNKTSYDKVNSAIYYAGQFMPTRMENALATRTVSMFFKNKNYSPEEKTNFAKLLNWTNSGISSLVVDVVKHRTYFEKRLSVVHAESERILKGLLTEEQYQERIFNNVSVLFTTYALLKDKLDFVFNQKEVTDLCLRLIIDNSEQISESNGLTEFWNIVTFLYERGQITKGFDFVLDRSVSFKVMGEKRSEKPYSNHKGDEILFLRLKSVYQHYNLEVSRREGVDVIGNTTLRHYFKSRPYFLGLIKAKRFGKAGSLSCYAFNYTAMKAKGILSLEEDTSAVEQTEQAKTDNGITDTLF
ncbi:DNA primase [Tenacibaculum maritimum]|uniref:DNA primase n=1 Tax=Tenacibaculum maritimum TaxID=107401 RepID=UPI003876C2D8